MATSAPEGIMALPENSGMNQGPRLSLEESSDAINQGLRNASPQAAQAVQQATSAISSKLEGLSDKQLDLFIQFIQYLYDNPQEYKSILEQLISDGAIPRGVFPEEHNPELLATLLYAAIDAKKQRGGGQRAPMQAPVGMARGGIADAARMVAAQGRAGDTMLAHITPQEAQMLRARGGAGTVNPATGLPEYGFFLTEIFDFIKEVTDPIIKPIVEVAKDIVESPIGKVLTTVALTAVLGPYAGAFAAPLASAGTTLLAGGNLKDALISGATAYFGAPGGAVSNFVGKMGITNQALNAAISSGIVGTGAAALSGKSLEDSVKTGLMQGVIGGAVQVGGNLMGGDSLKDAFGRQIPGTPAAQQSTAAQKATEGVATPGSASQNVLTPNKAFEAAGLPLSAKTIGQTDPFAFPPSQAQAAYAKASFGQTAPPTQAPYSGNLTFASLPKGPTSAPPPMEASFMDQAKGLAGKAWDYIAPSKQGLQGDALYKAAAEEQKRAAAQGFTLSEKEALAKVSPNAFEKYGPLAAAGIGALALGGGFKSDQPTSAGLVDRDASGKPITGADLIAQNPRKYYMQGLPGVQYDERGAIVGGSRWSPTATMADVRVPSSQATSTQLPSLQQGIFAPRRPMQPIYQPYNTPSMYTNLVPQYAVGGIASLGQGGYPRKTGEIDGPGTGTSDDVPAMLSDGEFVMTAKAVRGMGNGSRREGAKRMYDLMHKLERNAGRG